jgi:long-chain acyl-CoA synthetase
MPFVSIQDKVHAKGIKRVLTLNSALARTVRLYGDQTAILDPEGCFNWVQFADRVARAASIIESFGVACGDRFAIICRNTFRNFEIMHAGYWMGAVPVPINYRLAPPEIAYVLDDAACKFLVLEDVFSELMSASELSPWSDSVLLVAPTKVDVAWPQYEVLLGQAQPADMHDSAEKDDALIVYTGGTTGRGKGVRLSHRNIVSNALQLGFELGPRTDDVYLHVAPLFHSAGLLAMPYAMTGAAQVFLPKFSAEAVFEAIKAYGVTATLMTPTMLIMALQEPATDSRQLSALRQLIYGSSPMAVEWIKKMLARIPSVEIVQAYGLTETSPILTLLHMAEHEEAIATRRDDILRSVGRQVPGIDMRIVDDEGNEQPPGKPGEIIVRGPNVTEGYLKRPEETAAAFRDGWFYTGDIGRMDEGGHLYLLDRKKDMIITGGEIVFSSEVEATLYQHPDVHECAVIGIPDETFGEALLAAVVAAPGKTLTADDLIAHCRGRIGGYKIPRHYVFLDDLPKSAMDKILKTELRRIYGGRA